MLGFKVNNKYLIVLRIRKIKKFLSSFFLKINFISLSKIVDYMPTMLIMPLEIGISHGGSVYRDLWMVITRWSVHSILLYTFIFFLNLDMFRISKN